MQVAWRHRALLSMLLLLLPVAVGPAGSSAQQRTATVITVGALPTGVAAHPATAAVYVTNQADSTISVIDGATAAVTDTLALDPESAPAGVAVNPATNTLYAALAGARWLAIVDTETNALVRLLSVEAVPWGVAVNSRTNRIYVAHLAGLVTVVDGAEYVTLTTVRHDSLRRSASIAVNEVTDMVYVANLDGGVTVIDGATNAVRLSIMTGMRPIAVAVDERSNAVYVAHADEGDVAVIDGATNVVRARVTVGGSARGIAVHPATGAVYVTLVDNSLVAIDPTTLAVVNLTDPALGLNAPQGIAIAATDTGWIANGAGATVTVLPLAGATEPPAAPATQRPAE